MIIRLCSAILATLALFGSFIESEGLSADTDAAKRAAQNNALQGPAVDEHAAADEAAT